MIPQHHITVLRLQRLAIVNGIELLSIVKLGCHFPYYLFIITQLSSDMQILFTVVYSPEGSVFCCALGPPPNSLTT